MPQLETTLNHLARVSRLLGKAEADGHIRKELVDMLATLAGELREAGAGEDAMSAAHKLFKRASVLPVDEDT